MMCDPAVAADTTAPSDTVRVPIASVLRVDNLGSGGNPPSVVWRAERKAASIANLQPASAVEWKIRAPREGLYEVSLRLGQWEQASTVLSVETRPYRSPDDPYATRFASRDTRDYGQTAGAYVFHDIGPLENANGARLTVPLHSGDNVLRLQNVTDRHLSANRYPPDLSDPWVRDWGQFAGNVHVSAISLTRVSDLPAMGTITGKVTGNLPAGVAVRRALVTANPMGQSPAEPSSFWKWGYYTLTRDDGTYTLTAPAGTQEVKAGRPSSYEVQGSPVQSVNVPASGSATANLALTSIFHDDGTGALTAFAQAEYFDSRTGNVGLLAVDGENGYKMGWIDPGDTLTWIVDAPQAGYYTFASSYTNGGTDGKTRVSANDQNSLETDQPAKGWGERTLVSYAGRLYLKAGPNTISQTLLSGNSDMDALHLTKIPDAP